MQLIGMLDSPYVRRVAISALVLGIPFRHRSLSVFRDMDAFRTINRPPHSRRAVQRCGGAVTPDPLGRGETSTTRPTLTWRCSMKPHLVRSLPWVLLVACLAGCSTYIPPGAKADLQAFAPANIQEGFAAKATAPFPASIAAVRVQAPAYANHYLQQNGGKFGTGRYSVITAREVEEQAQFDRVARLPQVAGLVSINRMLLPERLESDREIREAASRLQADLVILYTFDTSFFDTDLAKPLSVITLGLSPTRKISVTTTASALLLDTRTGYIYSAYEVTTRADTLATSWGSRDTADEGRRRTERDAFGKLIEEFVTAWPKLLERHAKRG
jgi:hypothetical protein